MSGTAPIARLSGVRKSYDGATLVVKDLDLDIARGEFLTLLGPSGSGKTTTLMMLAGFEAPTAGRIELSGRDITGLPPHRRGIGVVFQNYALFPHMTVGENVAYPLRVRGLGASQAAARVAAALATVNLDGFRDRRPAQLSGGQQQRVALARAMVFEPELILLDEPLGALDRQLRERMQIELKALHERLGVTMIYVTHDQSEALTLSDRIAVFADGRIQQLATPFDLYENPCNAFVAGFIGESNRFEGRVVGRDGDRLTVETWGGRLVQAAARDVPGDATRVILSIRPERLSLGAGHRDNHFAFPLDSVVYLGDVSRLILALPDGGQITVKANEPANHLGFRRGQEVRIGWNADDCRAFAV